VSAETGDRTTLVGRMRTDPRAIRWMAGGLSALAKLSPWDRSILLSRYRAIYLWIPKVACSSLKTAFAPLLCLSVEAAHGDPHHIRFPRPVRSESLQRALYPGYYRFGFVRNPWDRLVSCYRDKIKNEVGGYTHFTLRPGVANCLARFEAFVPDMSFDAFVDAVASIPDDDADEHFRSQHTFLTNRKGELVADFVGRYERLAEDFDAVRAKTGLPEIALPRLQAARTVAKYAPYYTDRTRAVVAERFRKDIEMFGYEFGG
jgi:chondroitin 4-sulfotransferase 11